MHRNVRRTLTTLSAFAAVMVTGPAAVAAPVVNASEAAVAARPAFKMPFECGQTWLGSNWSGHSPAHSIDWNHYDANGNPDDTGRRVFASAGGTVLDSYYSTTSGYGNTIVIGHGGGWQTRYAHLQTRSVQAGDTVAVGQKIGEVGNTSALYDLSPHLHYEQKLDGAVVVAVVQGVTWGDYLKRNQVSNNRC
ncbi:MULTISPECIES: M23 family metallopeptidase [unclassified Streptomyces]|uniref:M23 family metallopeptidase n=1 Tax=unclassified Streptomyces TaxID=2593676 RepID=UPI002E2FA924|nr:M23 family metallopeptidase [Streptomyces sp. NBC_01460]WSS29081.1 M23 family metallopeptidase [Streptomyces sp. NBC_01185]